MILSWQMLGNCCYDGQFAALLIRPFTSSVPSDNLNVFSYQDFILLKERSGFIDFRQSSHVGEMFSIFTVRSFVCSVLAHTHDIAEDISQAVSI